MQRALSTLSFVTLASCALFAQKAPTSPTFEVASVRPNRAGPGHSSIDRDGGVFRMTNVTLKACITLAYGVADSQVSGPGWLDSERYDIVAKADGDARNDQSPLRLRALLADRFALALHRERKETSVYALVIAKGGPKMSKDDSGDSDTRSKRGHLTAKAVSMAELADFLAGPRVLGWPVVDKTSLDGGYSFTLDWTPETSPGMTTPGPAPEPGANLPPSILVAVQEQLGLKLEARRAPVEMLIVDRAEKVPTEN